MGKRSDVRRLHKEVSRDLDDFKREIERETGKHITDAEASLAMIRGLKYGKKESDEILKVFGFK